jgi:hypothetical protein
MSGQNQIIKVGLFGCGKWGKMIADKLIDHPNYELSFISTWSGRVPESLNHIKKFNGWHTDQTNAVDLIYVAAYPNSNFGIIKEAIIGKKAIICEKPALVNFEKFMIIDSLLHYGKHNKLFLTNFTYLFNHRFQDFTQQLKKLNKPGTLYFNVRGPTVREKISVKQDYGSHVIAMIICAINYIGYNTSEINWEIKENGGTFNVGKYNGVFNWATSEERDVSVGFVDTFGESFWWRDDRKFDAVGAMLNFAADAIINKTEAESSNIQLMAETVFALDENASNV